MAESRPGPGRSRAVWFATILAATILAATLPALALQPSTPLANYARQAWIMENGLPQNTVQALVQGADGFIWIGTEVGLVRFDANSFQLFDKNTTPALPGNDVRCLLAAGDGALWIGTSEGLARWKDGTATSYTTKDGLPGNVIESLAQTGDGELWANTPEGLARLAGRGFVRADQGGPAEVVNALTVVKAGYLWASTPAGLYQSADGKWYGPNFKDMFPGVGARLLYEMDPGGWMAATSTTVVLQTRAGKETRLNVGRDLPGSKIQVLFADRAGGLWIGTNAGLVRWVDGKAQRLPVTDPLAAASILSVMEDREGDLWVGTESDGLHILRDQRFRTLGVREGLSSDATTAVVEDRAATLWVGTSGAGLNAIRALPNRTGAHIARTWTVRDGLLSDVILSLAAAPNGDLWVGTPDGLNRIRSNAVTSFTSADGLPDDFIRSLLCDQDGSLWIGTRRGLTHWPNPGTTPAATAMETFTVANGLGSNLVGAMTKDQKGNLWVATFAGLSRLHDGKIENFTTSSGLSSNVITSLLIRPNGSLLIGTQEHGWNLWDGKKFTSAGQSFNPLRNADIHSIVDDNQGHLWFATEDGITRADCPETNPSSLDAVCRGWLQFGSADGLRSRETAVNSHPSAWRSHDGDLWFATPSGLVEVDPATFPINTNPPPVALERFAIDDTPQPLHGSTLPARIPAGHVHFEFDYAGLSFVAPQKVRYRYMLQGFDHEWTDAGSRRTAYYTNIPAGSYTFHVQAANNDGIWNQAGAALTFDLRPHFYQTWWFYALLILSAAGLVLLAQRLRLRRAEREFDAVLGERNRIAREVHDTLAQGYVGISVQLEVLAELLRLSKLDAAAKHLDQTRGYVREGLADARQSIWALRSQDSGETTLPVRLRRIVESAGGNGLQTQFGIFGAYRPLPPGTEREILRVAQEAIHNVKKHAAATQLQAQLEYRPDEVILEVADNGHGFAIDKASVPGHYGLTGMRERAKVVGGTLDVASTPGTGTALRMHVPARRETQDHIKEQS